MYSGGAFLLALLSLPLIAGKIKPNPYYGFRAPLTMGSPKIWYAANKYFAKLQLITALIIIVAATGLYYWPGISVDAYALSILAIFTFAFSAAFFQGWRYMKTLG